MQFTARCESAMDKVVLHCICESLTEHLCMS
jgi:hypothetical protein